MPAAGSPEGDPAILPVPPPWAEPGQESPDYPGRVFLDLCVGGFLLEPEELSALPFCDNGVGEKLCRKRAGRGFKILLLPTVLREPRFAFTWIVRREGWLVCSREFLYDNLKGRV